MLALYWMEIFRGCIPGLNSTMKGGQPPLKVCGLTDLKVTSPPLFVWQLPTRLEANSSKIFATQTKTKFIEEEVAGLPKNNIIKLSWSPWRGSTTSHKRWKPQDAISLWLFINYELFHWLGFVPPTQNKQYGLGYIDVYCLKCLEPKSAYNHVQKIRPFTAFEA